MEEGGIGYVRLTDLITMNIVDSRLCCIFCEILRQVHQF